MVIYGDISKIDCGRNGAKITAIDASHNNRLKALWCRNNYISSLNISGCSALVDLNCRGNMLTTLDISDCVALTKFYCDDNNFSTQTLDSIYCALPLRQAEDNAKIYPIVSADAGNSEIVFTTNKQNAVNRGWSVLYGSNSADFTTTGTYVCGMDIVNTTVATASATDIAQTSATLNGSFVQGTCGIVTEKGFEWRATDTGSYTEVLSASVTDTFSADIINLRPNTSYTFRAFVKIGYTKIYGEEATFTTEATTGMENVIQSISVYPNPAKDILNISSDEAVASIELYNMLGEKVLGTHCVANDISIDVSSLSNGAYILKIRTVKGVGEYKVIVKN